MTTRSIYKTPAGEQAVMALYDAFLEQWPVPRETLKVPTRQGETFVIAAGRPEAPPLVLLHGAGTNSAIWGGDFAVYTRYYRVYAADLPGEAGKSAPNRPDWQGPAFAEWLEDVLTALGVQRPTLAGISQGGWTTLKYAVEHPEKVEKLVLLCPGGVRPDRAGFIFKALFYSLGGEWGNRRLARLLYGDQPVNEEVYRVTAIMTRNFRPRVGVLPLFTDEQLQRLQMPVLLLGGTKDALRDNAKIAARLRSLLPRLEVRLLPGAGHALVDTTGPVLAFLKPVAAAVPGQ